MKYRTCMRVSESKKNIRVINIVENYHQVIRKQSIFITIQIEKLTFNGRCGANYQLHNFQGTEGKLWPCKFHFIIDGDIQSAPVTSHFLSRNLQKMRSESRILLYKYEYVQYYVIMHLLFLLSTYALTRE